MSTPNSYATELISERPEIPTVPFFPRFIKIWELIKEDDGPLNTLNDFTSLWQRLAPPELNQLLSYLYDKFCTFGYVGLQHRDGFIENADGQALLAGCRDSEIDDWSDRALALASMFWLFDSAAVLVTEYNQRPLELDAIKNFLTTKCNQYLAFLQKTATVEATSVVTLCKQISDLRASIPAHFVRSFSINGETWEREERYLDGSATENVVYPGVLEEIRNHLGFELPEAETVEQRFHALIDLAVAQGINPFEILVALAKAAVKDSFLQADYAVITVPQGRGLDAFWDTRIKDVCSYAVVRPDFSSTDQSVEYQPEQICRSIQRRMRFNTSCRSKNYHPLPEVRRKAQPFQFPDIAFNESSHHVGHIRSGIRNSARTHFEIRIPQWTTTYGEFRGFGDLRVNRATDEVARRYTFAELEYLLAYGRWCKTVFDYTLAQGVFMDAKYCED